MHFITVLFFALLLQEKVGLVLNDGYTLEQLCVYVEIFRKGLA